MQKLKILILGGTYDGFELATALVDLGHHVTTSLAGRTQNPKMPKGEFRIGGFSTPNQKSLEGLCQVLQENAFDLLIDATHPFANKISQTAFEAAKLEKIPRLALYRKGWQKKAEDIWQEVYSINEAYDALPEGARAFIALGAQHIAPFVGDFSRFYLFRMMDQPEKKFPHPNHQLSLGRPGDVEAETALLKLHKISHLICRNSGAEKVYAKIIAARHLKIPVILIEPTNPPSPPYVATPDEAIKWIFTKDISHKN